MRGHLRRIFLYVLCTTALLCALCMGANAYTYSASLPSDSQLARLQVTVGSVTMPLEQYPDGAYFDPEKCYMTVEEQAQYGLSVGSDIYLRGWECVGFARYVYTALFYKYPADATIDNYLAYQCNYNGSYYYTNVIYDTLGTYTLDAGYSASTIKTLFSACQPGAVMRVGGHSMVLMAIYSDGIVIYDANFSSTNEVDVRSYTWQEFVDTFSGRAITALQMPKYYPGYTYSYDGTPVITPDSSTEGSYVVYNCSTLNVRSGPATSYSRVGGIASGTVVYSYGSYNGWSQILYNEQKRWVYSNYLKPVGTEVTVTFDANGGTASFTTGTYTPGVTFGTLPTATKSGRVLLGWYDGDTLYDSNSTVPAVSSLTLTAKWCVEGFTDVSEDSWYADYIEAAFQDGLIAADTLFNPERVASRAEFVTVLAREYQRESGLSYEIGQAGSSIFTDVVAGSYYDSPVGWAYANEVVRGTSETTFSPTDIVTREQIAVLLYRYAKSIGAVTDGYTGKALIYNFYDGANVSDYAVDAMNWAIDVGLIKGDTDGNLNPKNGAKRCEMVTIMARFIEYLGA